MWRALKRWLSNIRAGLRRLRRASRNEGRFEAPHRRLVSRLLLTFRAYRLYLPAAVARRNRLPLLVMLHGCKQDAEAFAEGTRMNEIAERNDFIVLYPEQSRTANSYGCWNWFQPAVLEGAGEASAIVRIVRRVAKAHAVDTTRVYVAGMSAGGAMAAVLANRHGTLFAACAIHSGLKYGAAASAAAAVAAMRDGAPGSAWKVPPNAAFVPTLVIHGDRDRTVNPVNAEQIIEQARLTAGDNARPLVESPARRLTGARHAYVLRDYARGGKAILRRISIEDLDHAWSGGDGRHPFNDPAGPDASRLIWDFVKDFRRLPDGTSAGAPAWRFSLSAIWDRLRRRA